MRRMEFGRVCGAIFCSLTFLSSVNEASVVAQGVASPEQAGASPEARFVNTSPLSSEEAVKQTPVRIVGPGKFSVGEVTLHQAERTVTFEAKVNMVSGPIEYYLVASDGKLHEAIFTTAVQPYHLHVAMLLLGAKGDSELEPVDPKTGQKVSTLQRQNPIPEKMIGDKVLLSVDWDAGGEVHTKRAGELVINTDKEAALDASAWVYNASHTVKNRFIGQEEGSLISMISDPFALINNTSLGFDNDEIWEPNTKALPEVGTEVRFTIKLL